MVPSDRRSHAAILFRAARRVLPRHCGAKVATGLDRALEIEQRRTHMLHYVWMFVIGILVGLLARAILPGTQHMGLLMTGVLGIVGSYVGGLLTRIVHKPADGSVLHPAGIVMSVIGAIIVLYLWYRFGA